MAPTMKNKIPIPRAEMNKEYRRPTVSMPNAMKTVTVTTLTMPVDEVLHEKA